MTEDRAMPTPTELRKKKSVRFEVINPKGGKMKFTTTRSDPTDKYPEPAFFLASLDHGFQYVGQINPSNGKLVLTGGSKFDEDSPTVKVGRFALSVIFGNRALPDGFTILGPPPPKPRGRKKKSKTKSKKEKVETINEAAEQLPF